MAANLSTNLFARLETLRKWQEEQQERLLKQHSQQEAFLSSEQKRLTTALNDEEAIKSTPVTSKKLEPILEVSSPNIDEKEILPNKDFNELLDDKLNKLEENDTVVKTNMSKPKRPFLKKGSGLARYRMSHNAPKSTQVTKVDPIQKENFLAVKSGVQEIIDRASWAQVLEKNVVQSPQQDSSLEQSAFERQLERELALKKTLEQEKYARELNSEQLKPQNVKKVLEKEFRNEVTSKKRCSQEDYIKELRNEIQMETPCKNFPLKEILQNDKTINHLLEKEKDLDELKLFELLEQKALNNSFCSNSSVINKLLGLCTPTKAMPLTLEPHSDVQEDHERSFNDDTIWETDDVSEKCEISDSETSETISSINVLCIDAATNTEIPYPSVANTDLLRIRLEELEKEIETFRSENNKVTRLRNDLSKERKGFEKEVQELKQQLDEERKKMNKEKQLLNDKYIREMKVGTKKEREEISALKSELANVKEELKLKETRYGSSQARQRNQIRTLEKEVSSLKAENDKLRTENGKLQSQVQQFNKRQQPPSDTKVLHEISKNLSLLTKNQRRRSTSETSSISSDKENEKEMPKTPHRKNTKTKITKRMSDPNFDSVARDYERVFGSRTAPPRMDGRASSESNDAYSERIQNTTAKASAERIERLLPDGTKEITYANGNIKSIHGDKISMRYYNGDIKETNPETATVRYYYADANIWHTTYAEDGLEVLEFPDGQVEKRRRDGSSEITCPDGCIRCISPAGTETVSFPDGTIVVHRQNGEKVLTLPNGQKEIHTSEHKRREYPDGTVKILYPDGTQETRYANGRIRLKDINGELIMDTADMGFNS